MNYLRHYVKLMHKAKIRGLPEEPYEQHHVFPRSIYGDNANLVALTLREHLIAHLLLWKLCEKRYGNHHWKTKKMCFAASQMGWKRKCGEIITSKLLTSARKSMSTFLCGENNPAKNDRARIKISRAKLGKPRLDMIGKKYFGADEETIARGIDKMSASKRGQKIQNYPKSRKSVPCSAEKANKIKESRLKTKDKYLQMSTLEFEYWLSSIPKYRKDGKKNPNVTRALVYRNIDVTKYYKDLEIDS